MHSKKIVVARNFLSKAACFQELLFGFCENLLHGNKQTPHWQSYKQTVAEVSASMQSALSVILVIQLLLVSCSIANL
jgi:hypothetical protein